VKQGDALLPLLSNLALEYTIRKIQENQEELEFKGTHQLLICAADEHMFYWRLVRRLI
jgi:hypothetical protein